MGTHDACRVCMRGLGTGVVIAALVSSGCLVLDIGARECDNGRICPEGTRCSGEEGACIPATCGNGVAAAEEECDGPDLRGQTCTSLGFHDEGGLRCRNDCTFDTSACGGRCGDGRRDKEEPCDGDDLADKTCRSFGYYDDAGLSCQSCAFDLEQCQGGRCGDGIVNGSEQCDGAPPEAYCMALGFDAGSPRCTASCGQSVATCGRIGWITHPMAPVQALWGDGVDLVALNDTVNLYSGSVWADMGADSSFGKPNAVWGINANNFWIGTQTGKLRRWDGERWGAYINSDDVDSAITGLWGSRSDTIYYAYATYAGKTESERGGLLRFDGRSWSKVQLPPDRGDLQAIWGSSLSDVYAVGEEGTILHFDGSGWTTKRFQQGAATLEAVWGSGPNDVYAVSADQVLHFDGESWSPRSPPRATAERFVAISGSAFNDVYLVAVCAPVIGTADAGPTLPRGCSHNMWRYDGQRWSLLRSSTTNPLSAVWVDSPTRVWFSTRAGVEEFHGVGYVDVGGIEAPLQAVWAAAPHDYFVATSEVPSRILHVVDGVPEQSWTIEGQVEAFLGWAADDIYAHTSQGLLHFDGNDWQTVTTEWIDVVWGEGRGRDHGVYACTRQTIQRYDGQGWQSVAMLPSKMECDQGWSSGPDDVYVIVDLAVLHWDGAQWTPVDLELDASPPLVWGWARDDVYIASRLRIFHFDGARWSSVARLHSNFDQVAAIDRDDVFVVSSRSGLAAHFDGYRWAPMKAMPEGVVAIAGTPGRVFIVHENGLTALVRTARWGCREREIDCHDTVDDDCDGHIDITDPDCGSVR